MKALGKWLYKCISSTYGEILVESGIDNTSSNISTIPITILTTILYTSKIYIFLNHNTGTILEQIFIPVLCTILVYH
jgi:hypothetical protein